MTVRQMVTALLFGVLLTACVRGEGPDGTTMPQRPEPAATATGPEVRTLMVSDTGFSLHDEGDGCLALAITHPGLQPTVERHCFEDGQVLGLSNNCGWLALPSGPAPGGCDLTLPEVFFGQVREPSIGYVCVGSMTSSGEVVSARLLSLDAAGYILDAAQPGEGPAAHLFTRGGLRYGFAPLDAPSDPIYRFCEEQAPWGTTEHHVLTRVFVSLGEALRTDDVIVWVDSGTGPIGVSGSAVSDGSTPELPMEVGVSSLGLSITIQRADAAPLEYFRAWPEAVRTVLDSGVRCQLSLNVRLAIADAALASAETAVELTLLQNQCGF